MLTLYAIQRFWASAGTFKSQAVGTFQNTLKRCNLPFHSAFSSKEVWVSNSIHFLSLKSIDGILKHGFDLRTAARQL